MAGAHPTEPLPQGSAGPSHSRLAAPLLPTSSGSCGSSASPEGESDPSQPQAGALVHDPPLGKSGSGPSRPDGWADRSQTGSSHSEDTDAVPHRRLPPSSSSSRSKLEVEDPNTSSCIRMETTDTTEFQSQIMRSETSVEEASRSTRETMSQHKFRLVFFILGHLMPCVVIILSMINFYITDDVRCLLGMLGLFSMSGLFCGHAAWSAQAPRWAPRILPLQEHYYQGCWLLLALGLFLFGFLQGIIVVLALEDYERQMRFVRQARQTATLAGQQQQQPSQQSSFQPPQQPQLQRRQLQLPQPQPSWQQQYQQQRSSWREERLHLRSPPPHLQLQQHPQQRSTRDPSMAIKPVSNKWHCKAVIGLFEGLGCAGICLYAFWTMNYPVAGPFITVSKWKGERRFLGVACWVMLISSGMGVLELDHCVSRTVAARMNGDWRLRVMHSVFRVSEGSVRMLLYVWFSVALRLTGNWWWFLPITFDACVTVMLVTVFGGAESSVLVRLLCSFPCMWSNIFLFIDSPYKRSAATRLSYWLTVRNLAALVVMPLLGFWVSKDFTIADPWQGHPVLLAVGGVMLPMYLILYYLLVVRKDGRFSLDIPDMYAACQSGSSQDVRSAIEALSGSPAVGLNMNCSDVDGWTMLMLAANGNRPDICQLLIQEGAKPELVLCTDNRITRWCIRAKRRRWNAVHMAAAKGYTDVIKEILVSRNDGDDLYSWTDCQGDTPLHLAARFGHRASVIEILRRRPTWAGTPNRAGRLPCDLATAQDVMEVFHWDSLPDLESEPAPSPGAQPIRAEKSTLKEWQAIELQITHVSSANGEVQKICPGLCSYVASCCGGALGRIFLANAPHVHTNSEPQACTTMAEMPEPGGSFRPQVPGHSQRLSDQLVLIDRDGNRLDEWERTWHSYPVAGVSLMHPPSAAILGSGAHGTVLRMISRQSGKWYAVKTFCPSSGHPILPQAKRECLVADKLRVSKHPFVVGLEEIVHYEAACMYALVMEFAEGGDLQTAIATQKLECFHKTRNSKFKFLPHRSAFNWISQIFLGLEHLNVRMDVLLRDLKPANVVLDHRGVAKLSDFGVSRLGTISDGRWSFGAVPMGTPGYVAPEIVMRQTHSYKADLYSFGVLLWVLLTGGIRGDFVWKCESCGTAHQAHAGDEIPICPSCCSPLALDCNPQPPTSYRPEMTQFSRLEGDCATLKAHIRTPKKFGVGKLVQEAQELIEALIQRDPLLRPSHADVRAFTLMAGLEMPPQEALPQKVQEYCDNLALLSFR